MSSETKHRGGLETEEQYKGVPVHAAPGVHQKAVELLQSRIEPGSRVLDLGAGHGALSLRLHDAGYDVVAFDLNASDWKVPAVPCHQLDFNLNFNSIASYGPFAAICAIEIIEHLENPRGFLRDLITAAATQGVWLIVSTPNPLDTFSSITHFTRGTFNWFSEEHYYGGGHISILPPWLLRAHLEHLGATEQEWHFVAPFRHPSRLKRRLYNGITAARRLVAKGKDQTFFSGQTALVVARLPQTPAQDK